MFTGALSAPACEFKLSQYLNGKPDKLLVQEDERIAQLPKSTEISWEQIEATAQFRYGRAYGCRRGREGSTILMTTAYRFLGLALLYIYGIPIPTKLMTSLYK
jgi:hypothetical protein